MSGLYLKNVRKIYNEGTSAQVDALRGIDLEVLSGEMTAITGPSGSGKSTLLHILGCLDRVTSGEYFIDQEEVSELGSNKLARIRNKKFGFVLQEFGLLLDYSSQYNISFPLVFNPDYRLKKTDQKIYETMERLGIAEKQKIQTKYLSGGQKQRVAIARAIINDPDIILADEPTGALDSKTSDEIMGLFDELHRQGKTIIIVTHDKSIAERCERQIVLHDGTVIEDIRKT